LVLAAAAISCATLSPLLRGAAASAHADELQDRGEYAAGRLWRERAVAADPGDAQAQRDLAKVEASRWRSTRDPLDLSAALYRLALAARLQPTDGVNYFLAARWRLESGDATGAAALAGRALQVYPTYTEARAVRAQALRQLGDQAGALAEYRELARLYDTPLGKYPATDPIDPVFGEAFVELARDSCRSEPRRVPNYLDRAKQHFQQYFRGLGGMQQALAMSGRYDPEAVAHYRALQAEAQMTPEAFCTAQRRKAR
jgi:hypothetical protein